MTDDNGLGALAARQKQRRGKNTRRQEAMPPPRHPRAEPTEPTEAQTPAAPAEDQVEPAQSAEASTSPGSVAQPPPVTALPTEVITVAPRAAEPPAAAEVRSDATRARRTPSIEVYLPDGELTDWINEVEDAGFARRQRAILSPVVRLALNRLRAEMTAKEVVEEVLRNAPPPTGRRGRPRL